jgi:hypothetical protein
MGPPPAYVVTNRVKTLEADAVGVEYGLTVEERAPLSEEDGEREILADVDGIDEAPDETDGFDENDWALLCAGDTETNGDTEAAADATEDADARFVTDSDLVGMGMDNCGVIEISAVTDGEYVDSEAVALTVVDMELQEEADGVLDGAGEGEASVTRRITLFIVSATHMES